jgi:cell division protein ZapA (FtsZ GTPase activity inhibitor)
MQLSNLEFSSAASQCSGMSLSAFLCRDNLCESPGPDDFGGDNGEGDCEGDFDEDGPDSSKPPSPRNSNSDWLMLSPGTAQRQKQRATSFSKDASIPQTPYSIHSHLGPAPKPTPMGGPCEALLAASYEVYRSSGGSPGTHSSTNSNRILRPQRKCSSFSVSGIADRVKDNGRLACLEDANYNTSLRAFSIVSALLIQHCIVAKVTSSTSTAAPSLTLKPKAQGVSVCQLTDPFPKRIQSDASAALMRISPLSAMNSIIANKKSKLTYCSVSESSSRNYLILSDALLSLS